MTLGNIHTDEPIITAIREQIANRRRASVERGASTAGVPEAQDGRVIPRAGGEAGGEKGAVQQGSVKPRLRWRGRGTDEVMSPRTPPSLPTVSGVKRPDRHVYKPRIPGSGGWKVLSAVTLGPPQLVISGLHGLSHLLHRKFFSVEDRIVDSEQRMQDRALRDQDKLAVEDEHRRNYVERLQHGLGEWAEVIDYLTEHTLGFKERAGNALEVARHGAPQGFQAKMAEPAVRLMNALAARTLQNDFDPNVWIDKAQDGGCGTEARARFIPPLMAEVGYRAMVLRCTDQLRRGLTNAALGGVEGERLVAGSPRRTPELASPSRAVAVRSEHQGGMRRRIFNILDCPVTTVEEARKLANQELYARVGSQEAKRIDALIDASPFTYEDLLAAIENYRANFRPSATILGEGVNEEIGDPRHAALQERVWGTEPPAVLAQAWHDILSLNRHSSLVLVVHDLLSEVIGASPLLESIVERQWNSRMAGQHEVAVQTKDKTGSDDEGKKRKKKKALTPEEIKSQVRHELLNAFLNMMENRDAWVVQKRAKELESNVEARARFATALAETPESQRLSTLLDMASHQLAKYPPEWQLFAQKVLSAVAEGCNFYPAVSQYMNALDNCSVAGGGGPCKASLMDRLQGNVAPEVNLGVPISQLTNRFTWLMLGDAASLPGTHNFMTTMAEVSNLQSVPSEFAMALAAIDPEFAADLADAVDEAGRDSSIPDGHSRLHMVVAGPALEAVALALSDVDVQAEVFLNTLIFSGPDSLARLRQHFTSNATSWWSGKADWPAEFLLNAALVANAVQLAGSCNQAGNTGYLEALGQYAADMLGDGMGLIEASDDMQVRAGKVCLTMAAALIHTCPRVEGIASLMEAVFGFARSYSDKPKMPVVALQSTVLKTLKEIRRHPALEAQPALYHDFAIAVNEMIHRFLNIASSKGPTYAEQWANEDAVKTVLLRVSELIALLKPGAVFQELELPLRSPELSMTRLQGQDLPREGAGLANYFPDVNPKLTRINALMAGMAQFATQVVNLHTLSQQAALHAQKLADLEAAARVAQQDGRPIDEKAELQSIRLQEQLELESLAAVMANTEGQRPGASLWLLYYTLLFRNLEAVALEATHPEGGRVADPRITGVSMRTEGVPDLVVALALEDHYDRYKTVPDPQELQNAIGRVLAKDGAYNRRVAKLRATLRPIAKGHAVTSERVAQLEEEAIALYRSLGLA